MTEETTMDERDVELVARAIQAADQNEDTTKDPSRWRAWEPEARAAMAVRDEQIRARLLSEEARRILLDVIPGTRPADPGSIMHVLAAHVFGPAPRVEPAPPRATRERSDAMAMHYTESMHVDRVAPICGAPISPSSVTSSSAAVTCVECLRMRPLSVSPPFVEPAPPPASDTLEAAVERARKVYALECTQLQADVRKAEAEVERLTAALEIEREGREEAFRARDEASLRLSAECVRLTAERDAAIRNVSAPCDRCGHGKSAEWSKLEAERDAATREAKRANDARAEATKRAEENANSLALRTEELAEASRQRDTYAAETDAATKRAEEAERSLNMSSMTRTPAGERIDALEKRIAAMEARKVER